MSMQILGPLRKNPIPFVEKAAIMAECLQRKKKNARLALSFVLSIEEILWGKGRF